MGVFSFCMNLFPPLQVYVPIVVLTQEYTCTLHVCFTLYELTDYHRKKILSIPTIYNTYENHLNQRYHCSSPCSK